MKKLLITRIIFLVGLSLLLQFNVTYAQLGKLKDKIKQSKDKVLSKEEKPSLKEASSKNSTDSKSDSYNNLFVEKYNALNEIIQAFRSANPNIQTIKTKAQTLDYPATLTQLKAKGKSSIDNVMMYEQFAKFEQTAALSPGDVNRGVRLDKDLLKTANDLYNQAFLKKNTQQVPEAVKLLNEGKAYTETVLALFPNHSEAKDLNTSFERATKDLGADYEAYTTKIFTSDFHKQNVGKILFSKEPIVIGKEQASQFTTQFTAKDKIYAVAYLEGILEDMGNLKNYNYSDKNAEYSIQFDGQQNNISFALTPETRQQSYIIIEINPDPAKAYSTTDALNWYPKLANLSPKKHTMQLWFWAAKKQLATSEMVSLDWYGADNQALKSNAELATKKAEDNYAKVRSLPARFSQPVELFKDAQLSHSNISKMFMAKEPNCAQVLKVHTVIWEKYAGGADWEIKKNDIDIPIAKVINGAIGLIFKGKDGACYFVDRLYFFQTYQGGGKYASIALGNDYSKPQKIACEKVK